MAVGAGACSTGTKFFPFAFLPLFFSNAATNTAAAFFKDSFLLLDVITQRPEKGVVFFVDAHRHHSLSSLSPTSSVSMPTAILEHPAAPMRHLQFVVIVVILLVLIVVDSVVAPTVSTSQPLPSFSSQSRTHSP